MGKSVNIQSFRQKDREADRDSRRHTREVLEGLSASAGVSAAWLGRQ